MSLSVGDYAPAFTSRSSFHPAVRLEHLAGRYIALTFISGSAKPKSLELATLLKQQTAIFDDVKAMHFFVVIGESGEVKAGISPQKPGFRVYFDKTGDIAALYDIGAETAKPLTYILAPNRRIEAIITTLETENHAREICAFLSDKSSLYARPAPVLHLPNALEPRVIGEVYGEMKRLFLLEKSKASLPPDSQSSDDLRRLITIESTLKDERLNDLIIRRIMTRVIPEVRRSFAFNPEHIDDMQLVSMRFDEGARIDPMRYSEVKNKAHSRFSILIALDQLQVKFPEFSPKALVLQKGEALVFSCAMLVEIPRLKEGESNFVQGFLGVKPLRR